jgi:hypothetical protein
MPDRQRSAAVAKGRDENHALLFSMPLNFRIKRLIGLCLIDGIRKQPLMIFSSVNAGVIANVNCTGGRRNEATRFAAAA